MTDVLQQIRDTQFTDKPGAEALLLAFVQSNFPELNTVSVELTPKPTSLNSFNGFLTQAGGKRLFFKTHTESHTIINEYYNAELLAKAGYPIIQPVFRSTEPGKQFLVYEVIEDKAVFDIAWAIENGDDTLLHALTEAQNKADDDLLDIYFSTWDAFTAASEETAVHQLFYHRITSGRLENFYGALPDNLSGSSSIIHLPDGSHAMREVRQWLWVINGQHYAGTWINKLITAGINQLVPSALMYAITGHGDAHNGNVFFNAAGRRMTYFDPAFAGRHDPYLDLTKPLFHNVFAMWMYFPEMIQQRTHISMRLEGDMCHVEYDYPLHPVRQMFLRSKIDRVLIPFLQATNYRRGGKRWRSFLKAALFCCPFLTMNLADSSRFPPEISLLGLAMSIEMGAESQGERSLIDKTLDEVAKAVR